MFQLGSELKIQKNQSNIVDNYACINGKPAYRVCTQKNCPNPSLCCQDQSCTCNELHLLCTQIRLKSLLQKLYSKVVDTTGIMTKFTNLFDCIIDRVSQIYDETQKKIKRYGLRHAQIKFLQYLQENRAHSLTGKIVHDAKQIADVKYDGEFWQIQLCVDRLWEELGGLFWGVLYSTQDMYEIPTRVNRMNPDSGEEFFTDLIEQTKITLRSLQNMKMWNQNEFQIKHPIKVDNNFQQKVDKKQVHLKVNNKIEENVAKKQEKKQVQHVNIRIQNLGYSDSQQMEAEQQKAKAQKPKQQRRIIEEIQQQKHLVIDSDINKAVMKSKVEERKEQQNDNTWIQKILRKVASKEKPQLNELQTKQEQVKRQQVNVSAQLNKNRQNFSIEQLRKKQSMRQKVFSQYQEEQVKLREQVLKPQLVENEQKIQQLKLPLLGNNKAKVPSYRRNLYEQSKELIEATSYLCQTTDISLKNAKEFIAKHGYNRQGKLLSQEQILDLLLIEFSSH